MGGGQTLLAWSRIAESFQSQALACRRLGSPFTARLCVILSRGIDPASVLGRRMAEWPGDPRADALALRLCGGLHALVRSGRAPGLAAVYPPRDAADADLRAALSEVLADNGRELAAWLDHAPQTNEVARSAVLLGGMQIVAAATGKPLHLLEIGASAGLNLLADHWNYELGRGQRWGAANAPVTIECDWRGAAPPLRRLSISGRAGADLAPIDPRVPAERERMLAYLWADQAGRLARAEAALEHAARHGLKIERADAASWIATQLTEPPDRETCRLLMHSIVWQYLTPETRHRITEAMVVQGIKATPEQPLAWLRMEADGERETAAVILTTWPGSRTRELGRADFHGRFVEWSGER